MEELIDVVRFPLFLSFPVIRRGDGGDTSVHRVVSETRRREDEPAAPCPRIDRHLRRTERKIDGALRAPWVWDDAVGEGETLKWRKGDARLESFYDVNILQSLVDACESKFISHTEPQAKKWEDYEGTVRGTSTNTGLPEAERQKEPCQLVWQYSRVYDRALMKVLF